MKITYLFLAFILSSIFVKAQQKTDPANDQAVITFVKDDLNWYDLQRQPFPVLQGQGWPIEQKGIYGRLPVRAKEKVRAAIWTLSEQCAGLTVRFRTNAAEIKVKYQVSDTQSFPHMSATGVSGLDLYTSNDKGKEVWSAGGYLFGDTIKYTFRNLNSMSSGSKEQEYLFHQNLREPGFTTSDPARQSGQASAGRAVSSSLSRLSEGKGRVLAPIRFITDMAPTTFAPSASA